MKSNLLLLAWLCFLSSPPTSAKAQGKATLARETANYMMKTFGKEASEIGVETIARKVESLAVRHGDDVFTAVRRVGPRSLRLVEEVGEHGTEAVKLMARHGDDAVWVIAKRNRMAIFLKYGDDAAESMMKHGEIAEPLLTTFGKPAASALRNVSSQNARRIAMLADEKVITPTGQSASLLDVIARHGDRAADFVWRNKGALAVASTLAVFIADPQPFLAGAKDLSKFVAENAVKPIANVPGQVASEVAKQTNWTIVLVCVAFAASLLVGLRSFLHRPVGTKTNAPTENSGFQT